jgi:hypothetical protein
MLIKEEPLKHWIDNFYGYGSWHTRFWFIGHEETGGEVPEDVADKINYFTNVNTQPDGTLCDIRELYKNVTVRWEGPSASSFNNLFEYRFDENAKQHNVWKNLIAFVHGYTQTKLPDLLQYQKNNFLLSSTHNEALISLYPLPGPNSHAWYYAWLDLPQLGFLKSRKLYEEHVYPRRIQTILSNISNYKPEVVLMYGMDNINTLKESIQTFFHNAKFKMIKASKEQIPQHHRADLNGTTMLLTTQVPALRHNRIETGFDWEEFGRRVKNHNSAGDAVDEPKDWK